MLWACPSVHRSYWEKTMTEHEIKRLVEIFEEEIKRESDPLVRSLLVKILNRIVEELTEATEK
jgi:hypothetical protein